MKDPASLDIVIPLFNEEENLPVLHQELRRVLQHLGRTYHIIYVDDGSRDATFLKVKAIAEQDSSVSGISLSRNFGHQIALLAGLQHSTAKTVITMDGDMQHPPSLIPQLLEEQAKGFDVVNTLRTDTADAGWSKKLTSALFYKLLQRMTDIRVQAGAADFRLMQRRVVDAFLQMPENDRFTRGMISWMGFRQSFIPYRAPERFAGKSKYTFRKMMHFALDAITSFSPKPLRVSFYLGLIAILTGLLYALFAIYQHMNGATIPGWTSLLLVVLLLGGIQLLSLGVIGEYIARIYVQAKSRPLYFVKDQVN